MSTTSPTHGPDCEAWPADTAPLPVMLPAKTGDRDLDAVMQSAAYIDALLLPILGGPRS